jgi:hypothetical protein
MKRIKPGWSTRSLFNVLNELKLNEAQEHIIGNAHLLNHVSKLNNAYYGQI